MMNLGDFIQSSVINFKYNTYNTAGASADPTGSGTIQVYKGSGTTQITAGITHTVTFDSIVGVHHIRIDLGSTSDYAINQDYDVVITSATIASQTVNGSIAHFSVENRNVKSDLRKIKGVTAPVTNLEDDYDGTGYDKTASTIKIVDGSITSSSFDNSTAFPLKQVDSGTSSVARMQTGTISLDSIDDRLNTLSGTFNDMKGGTFDSSTDSLEAIRDSIALQTSVSSIVTSISNISGSVALQTSVSSITTTLSTMSSSIDDMKGGTFDSSTDSLEAIRNRGDAAWITGGGGSITDILNIKMIIPCSVDLAGTATVRLGMMLTNAVDDLPSTAEISPGTISIDHKSIGGTSWTNIVNNAACSEQAGMIYYDEIFDSGSGYAEGDSIRITFKSQKITVAANDYEITDSNGVMFQTEIRQTMRGTDSASTFDNTSDKVELASGTIIETTFDNSTAFPLKNVDSGSSSVARIGSDSDTLKTISDQIDGLPATADVNTQMIDVLSIDKQTDLSNGTPPASATIVEMIKYCYAAITGGIKASGTSKDFYNKSGTKIFSKAVSGDDTQVIEGTATS